MILKLFSVTKFLKKQSEIEGTEGRNGELPRLAGITGITYEERLIMDEVSEQQIRQLNRYRWVVWVPLAFAFLASYFQRTATGVVADSLMREFSITKAADIGGLASVYFYIYAAMQLPSGILADTLGPRRTVLLALTTATVGTVIFGLAPNIFMLYVGRILSSIGVGMIYVCIVKIHAEWFRTREFTTMVGIVVVAGSVGFLLASTPLALLVENFGWRFAFLTLGAYSLAALISCWIWVKNRPVELGLPSITSVEVHEGTFEAVIENPSNNYSVMKNLKIVMGNAATWWPFLASFTTYGVYMAFMGLWAVPYFMQIYGISRVTASNYVMAMSIGTLVGGPLIGVLSDRIALRRLPNIMFTGAYLALWLVLTVWNGGKPPLWAWYPLCLGIGLGMSGVNLNVACGKEVNPPEVTGLVAGLVNSGPFVGGALLQPLFGWILDCNWRGAIADGIRIYPLAAYQNAFWVCAVILGFGLLFTCLIKETKGLNIYQVRADRLKN